ncbi:MAG: lipid-A-disaccharide synthase [Acidobacteriales bacterium]|nr:lipid-A-disaccharide synthase [Terriglobales bacterium]
MKLLISAGEASSDWYGAELMAALRRRQPGLEFMGVGGEQMRAAGCEIVVDARHLAVFGITEILSHLPRIYAEFRKLIRAAEVTRPDLAIVIDSPAFNFRVARELHQRGVPVVYFVAPQLWAWREYRVKRVQRWIRKVLCIFPFEVEFYRKHGVDVEYVGYPLADLPLPAVSRSQFAKENALDEAKTWIALLPGSRRKEVGAHLPTLLAAADAVNQDGQFEFVIPAASTVRGDWLAAELRAKQPRSRFVITGDARTTLSHSRAAVVTSGTATVEAALMKTPFIAVYRLSPFTFWAARRLVKVPHVAMPNLIAGEQIVPELLQDNFTPENVSSHLREILPEGPSRAKMLAGLEKVRRALRNHDARSEPAMDKAANAVLALLHAGRNAPELVQQHRL